MSTTVLGTPEAMFSRQASALPWNRMCFVLVYVLHFPSPLLTLVPSGIYVTDSDRWPERFRGIGIRIEDSVCVGDEHPIVLTPEAVKEVCIDSKP